jgi:hypothetical protein
MYDYKTEGHAEKEDLIISLIPARCISLEQSELNTK